MTERDAIDQLAALLDGEDVPGAPSSLGALAELATSVRHHADLMTPSPEFRDALRADLVAVADAPPGLVERARATWAARTAGLRASTRVAVATMTASSPSTNPACRSCARTTARAPLCPTAPMTNGAALLLTTAPNCAASNTDAPCRARPMRRGSRSK